MKHYSPAQFKSSGMRTSHASSFHENTTVTKIPVPIHTIQSPYNYSPNRVNFSLAASTDELDLYKQRCYELERQLAAQRRDTEMSKTFQSRSGDLEGKVLEVVEQNGILQTQLDRLSKQLVSKRNEVDLWKQKFEGQMSQMVQIKANYELEIQALSKELHLISAKIGHVEMDKNRCLSDQKMLQDVQNQVHFEVIKKSQNNQVEVLENQTRKMRDIIEDKTVQISQLHTLQERLRCESSDLEARLRNEVELLKNRMSSQQLDHQQEIELLRSKLVLFKDTQVKNQQQAHLNQSDMYQNEIEKLMNLLDVKNQEIETLITQNQKQKEFYQSDGSILRQEIDDLKHKLLENEQVHQQENYHIQSNLETMHNAEVTNIKMNNEHHYHSLKQEILKLKSINDGKANEIEKQVHEKQQQRDFYDGEVQRLLITIEEHKRKHAILEAERNKQNSDHVARIERLTQQNADIQKEQRNQIALFDQELQNLKALLNHKNQEIENNLSTFSQLKLDFENRIVGQKQEMQQISMRYHENEKIYQQDIADLKLFINEQEKVYKERIKALDIQVEHLKYEINRLNEMYSNKSRECENLIQQRDYSEATQRRLQQSNDEMVNRINSFDAQKNQEIDELKDRMDSQTSFQFENLKKAYNTQVTILHDQIQQLELQLQQRQKEFTDIVERYTLLETHVLPDSLVQKNMYNSRTGVPAEFIANKAIHDVLRKSSLRASSLHYRD